MGDLRRRQSGASLFVLTPGISARAFACASAAAEGSLGAKGSPLSPSHMCLFRDEEVFTSGSYYDGRVSGGTTITATSLQK